MCKITQERRNINANNMRTEAAQVLATTDFDKFMASGFNIHITRMDGKPFCPEFCVRGEDMEEIALTIVASLKQSLKLRRHMLLDEMRAIDRVIRDE